MHYVLVQKARSIFMNLALAEASSIRMLQAMGDKCHSLKLSHVLKDAEPPPSLRFPGFNSRAPMNDISLSRKCQRYVPLEDRDRYLE